MRKQQINAMADDEIYDEGLPEIVTKALATEASFAFLPFDSEAFESLVKKIIRELDLVGKIKTITAFGPRLRCAQLIPNGRGNGLKIFRDLEFDIYPGRYLDEKLIRHEFQHLADRYDPDLKYYPEIDDGRWDYAMNIAANISVDKRLAGRGLTRGENLAAFAKYLGSNHDPAWFDELWDKPPLTWRAIEDLAIKLRPLKDEAFPPDTIHGRFSAPTKHVKHRTRRLDSSSSMIYGGIQTS